jgi:hypothetical protein
MKRAACLIIAVLALIGSPRAIAQSAPSHEGGYALIYNGAVAAEGAADAVAEVARTHGLSVRFITDLGKLPEMIPGAVLFAIGGTEDDLTPLLAAFTPRVTKALRDYILAGGRYWGICGGGYIASAGWEDVGGRVNALKLISADSVSYIEDPDPRIITVTWLGKKREIYYQYGPAFVTRGGNAVHIVATYADGSVAALVATLGKGKVALSGPHPEAVADWLDDDPPPLSAGNWTPTADLAEGLLAELLADAPMR